MAEPIAVDVADVAADRVDAWFQFATERDVRLELRAELCPLALVVPGSLDQILDNLLSNAITAAAPGTTVTIHIGPDSPGSVEVRVGDHGPGLSEEQRRRAFEPFWRATDAIPGSGFGLGLAIVRSSPSWSSSRSPWQPLCERRTGNIGGAKRTRLTWIWLDRCLIRCCDRRVVAVGDRPGERRQPALCSSRLPRPWRA